MVGIALRLESKNRAHLDGLTRFIFRFFEHKNAPAHLVDRCSWSHENAHSSRLFYT